MVNNHPVTSNNKDSQTSDPSKSTKKETPVSKAATLSTIKKRKSKFFAIHIGPSKTGTSTIQRDSAQNLEIQNTLAADNSIYVGSDGVNSIEERRYRTFKVRKFHKRKFHKNTAIEGRGDNRTLVASFSNITTTQDKEKGMFLKQKNAWYEN